MPTFRVVFVKNPIYDIEAIFCPSCECLFRDPVQVISCGHRICHACIEKMESLRWYVYAALCVCLEAVHRKYMHMNKIMLYSEYPSQPLLTFSSCLYVCSGYQCPVDKQQFKRDQEVTFYIP